MNLEFLGDALDHWKGGVLELLVSGGALQRLAVDPMLSDAPQWSEPDFALYARLLRIQPAQLVRHTASIAARWQYFTEIGHDGDLFLDPDTGIVPRSGGDGIDKYLKPSEAAELLRLVPDRVVAVYQHARGSTSTRVDESVALVGGAVEEPMWCSYESANAAMLFFSENAGRIGIVKGMLDAFLGRHAGRRVRSQTSQRARSNNALHVTGGDGKVGAARR